MSSSLVGRSVIGFDIVAKKICEVSHTQHKLSPTFQDREILASVSHQLNSSFSDSGFGKQKLSKVAVAITPSTSKHH
jgi:hypothetical protein